jgi:hypothetical protein
MAVFYVGIHSIIVMADQIVVNSRFTASMFARAFDTDIKPEVLYPSIRPAAYDRPIDPNEPTLAPLKTQVRRIVMQPFITRY